MYLVTRLAGKCRRRHPFLLPAVMAGANFGGMKSDKCPASLGCGRSPLRKPTHNMFRDCATEGCKEVLFRQSLRLRNSRLLGIGVWLRSGAATLQADLWSHFSPSGSHNPSMPTLASMNFAAPRGVSEHRESTRYCSKQNAG